MDKDSEESTLGRQNKREIVITSKRVIAYATTHSQANYGGRNPLLHSSPRNSKQGIAHQQGGSLLVCQEGGSP